jgi:DNA-damage-inducible protein J
MPKTLKARIDAIEGALQSGMKQRGKSRSRKLPVRDASKVHKLGKVRDKLSASLAARERTSAKTGMIRARISPDLKARVEQILEKIGLSPSDAIRLFYSQVALRKGMPFRVRLPNATTEQVLREADAGIGLTEYADTDDMFRKLGIKVDRS